MSLLQKMTVGVSVAMLMASDQSIAQASPFNHCWTAVASAGVVDEADINIVAFDLSSAAVRSTTLAGTVDLHYSVVAVEGIFGGVNKLLTARIADNGPAARVIVKVRRTNLTTGAVTTLTTIDSNALALPTSSAHKVTVPFGVGTSEVFDFFNNVYWVDVQLIKSVFSGNPRVEAIQICTNPVS